MLTLHHYQKAHANRLADCIRQSRSAIDASDPGSGKTYVASSIAAELRVPVVILTTKATVPNWSSVAAGVGVTPILVGSSPNNVEFEFSYHDVPTFN